MAKGVKRSRYKVFIYLLKIIPMLIAICDVINTFLWIILGYDNEIFSYVGGISILPLLFIYLASYVFEFCEYHRMFLHYVVVNNIVSIIDYYFEIGFGYILYLIIIGIFLFLILYFHQKETKNDRLNKARAD